MRQQTLTTLLLSCLVVVFLPPASPVKPRKNRYDRAWIAGLDRQGPLTVGYGTRPETTGPELGFGPK